MDRFVTNNAKRAIIQTMLANTSQFRGLLDLDGTFLGVTEPALQFLQRPREALLGQPIWKGSWWQSEADRHTVRQLVSEAASGKFAGGEYAIGNSSGERWIDFLVKPLRDPDGNIMMVLAEGNDITERKRLEQQLKEREFFFTTLLGAMSEGVLYLDGAGKFSFCNPAAEQLLGQSRDALLGGSFLKTFYAGHENGQPFDVGEDTLPSARAISTGEAQRNFVIGVHKSTGEFNWLLVNHQPLKRGADGRVPGVVITLTDITERKELEEKLRHAALYDALTGLATRKLLLEHLSQAMIHFGYRLF